MTRPEYDDVVDAVDDAVDPRELLDAYVALAHDIVAILFVDRLWRPRD